MKNNDTEILAEIRDILLPLVDSKENICGDMASCCASNKECLICLAKQIRKQYETATN